MITKRLTLIASGHLAGGFGFRSVASLFKTMCIVGVLTIGESKLGYAGSFFTRNHVKKDIQLLNNFAENARWDFFLSGTTGKIGPSPTVLKWLEDAGIEVYIHFPV